MQWNSFVIGKRKGIISLTVLVLALALLSLVQGFLLVVHKENAIQAENIRKEQILNLGESLIEAATKKKEAVTTDLQLPKIYLYPGREAVTSKISNRSNIPLGISEIKIEIESSSENWAIYKNKLLPPGGGDNQIYRTAIYAQKGFSGKSPEGISVQDGKSGITMIPLPVSGYKEFGNIVLPTKTELRDYGLRKRLYYNTSAGNASYIVPRGSIIKGEGVFVDETGITIEDGCEATGLLWLISGSGIIIGDNVKLDKVLIVAKKNISIGNNVSINGIIISGGKVTFESDFIMTEDRMVLKPFYTVYYFL